MVIATGVFRRSRASCPIGLVIVFQRVAMVRRFRYGVVFRALVFSTLLRFYVLFITWDSSYAVCFMFFNDLGRRGAPSTTSVGGARAFFRIWFFRGVVCFVGLYLVWEIVIVGRMTAKVARNFIRPWFVGVVSSVVITNSFLFLVFFKYEARRSLFRDEFVNEGFTRLSRGVVRYLMGVSFGVRVSPRVDLTWYRKDTF